MGSLITMKYYKYIFFKEKQNALGIPGVPGKLHFLDSDVRLPTTDSGFEVTETPPLQPYRIF